MTKMHDSLSSEKGFVAKIIMVSANSTNSAIRFIIIQQTTTFLQIKGTKRQATYPPLEHRLMVDSSPYIQHRQYKQLEMINSSYKPDTLGSCERRAEQHQTQNN